VWLRRVAVCCSVLQSVAACRVPSRIQSRTHSAHCTPVTVRVMAAFLCTPARWYPIMTWVCCSVLQCVAVCCSALQCVAVRCRVLQCVAVLRVMRTCSTSPPTTHTHKHTSTPPRVPLTNRSTHPTRTRVTVSLWCSAL